MTWDSVPEQSWLRRKSAFMTLFSFSPLLPYNRCHALPIISSNLFFIIRVDQLLFFLPRFPATECRRRHKDTPGLQNVMRFTVGEAPPHRRCAGWSQPRRLTRQPVTARPVRAVEPPAQLSRRPAPTPNPGSSDWACAIA